MHQTLLSTKLYIPASYQELVHRGGLLKNLDQARFHQVTLVSAPPGYGKTTLVSSWLRGTAFRYAWLSLDESDNDPIRFVEYFLAALHRVVPGIQVSLLGLLQGSQAISFQSLMALVINEAAGAGDFFLVLDDFHVLHTPSILEMLRYLFENAPPGLHLVIVSRADPLLPLSRLRARGQLLEIRAEQLRFTDDEIARFFHQFFGIPLNQEDIFAIGARTEGWIAGLQLAGLAMQNALVPSGGRIPTEKDLHSFIAAFTGSHTYIMDYLTEEVLRSQPEMMQSFLLRTSILERMCGSLCENVTQTQSTGPLDGQSMLEELERNHLFVIPLDSERAWYRYHHLFREVLNHRLENQYPGQVSALHLSASKWFEQHGSIHEAIRHAVIAGDIDRTARLVEQHGCSLLLAGEMTTLADWLAAIEPYTHTRPWLAMQKAWALLLNRQTEQALAAIEAGEQLLAGLEPTGEIKTLLGSFSAARAYWANAQGQPDLAARYARHANVLLEVGGDFPCALRSIATSILGDASLVQGNMPEALRAYAEAARIGQIAGDAHVTMMSITNQADIYFEQGQLQQAARLYLETLQLSEKVDGPDSYYAQGIYFGLSRVYYAWNHLDEAAEAGEKCLELCRRWGSINWQAASLALFAQIYRASGRHDKAQESAAAAESLIWQHDLSPYWSIWVKVALARHWLNEGEVEKAFFLVRDTGMLPAAFSLDHLQAAIPLDEPVPYRFEPVALILARVFLARGSTDAVLQVCERLLVEAERGERGKAVMEILILQALAWHAKKDTDSALAILERVISMAWPEQAARIFLDEGERMAKLLYQAKTHDMGGKFVENLLSCSGMPRPTGSDLLPPEPVQNLLVEPLSAREIEVLRAIAEGCSNQEIADRFVLSAKTVKRHISNIYAKLDAKNRTQAVSLARSLKLIQ